MKTYISTLLLSLIAAFVPACGGGDVYNVTPPADSPVFDPVIGDAETPAAAPADTTPPVNVSVVTHPVTVTSPDVTVNVPAPIWKGHPTNGQPHSTRD